MTQAVIILADGEEVSAEDFTSRMESDFCSAILERWGSNYAPMLSLSGQDAYSPLVRVCLSIVAMLAPDLRSPPSETDEALIERITKGLNSALIITVGEAAAAQSSTPAPTHQESSTPQ